MRIAIFSCTWAVMNGVAVSVANLCKVLRQMGHDVHLFAPANDNGEPWIHPYPSITTSWAPNYPIVVPFSWEADSAIKRHRPQIIHTHHPWWMGDLALYYAWLLGSTTVSTVHTQYGAFGNVAKPLPAWMVNPILRRRLKWHCNRVNLVTTPGIASRQRLIEMGVKTPVEWVSNPNDLERFFGACGARVRREYRIGEDELVLGFVGRLDQDKNLPVLMDAAMRFLAEPNVRLMIVGDGKLRPLLKHMAGRLPPGKVIFTGRVPHNEIHSYYGAINGIITPSLHEVQPMVFAEGLAAGNIVLGFDAPGIGDTIRHRKSGLLCDPARGADSLADTALTVIRNRDLIAPMQAYAVEQAKEYDLMSAGTAMVRAYEQARDIRCASPGECS